jgi:glycosyltransferase involved in cell wall biosynthesis
LGLGDAVCFLGEVHEVPALLRQCEIGGLVPCRNEGLSNTILEYMAAGLPVLATDCGGNRELVQGNATGRLLPAGASAEAVGEGWIALLQDPSASVAMGRRGRETVERQHSRDAILDAFQRLYAGLGAAG